MQSLRRALILIHRYLGIPLSLLFVVWFVSGIAMIYVGGMPQLTSEERLEQLPELDLAAVRLTPAEAPRAAEIGSPGHVALLTVLGRPAYRSAAAAARRRYSRTPASSLDAQSTSNAEKAIAAQLRRGPLGEVHFVRTVERPDQWTLVHEPRAAAREVRGRRRRAAPRSTSRRRRPGRARDDDARRARSPGSRRFRTGSTSRRCARISRSGTGPWCGRPELGCVLAVLGLVLGVTQFRKSTPFSFAKSIRYRVGCGGTTSSACSSACSR